MSKPLSIFIFLFFVALPNVGWAVCGELGTFDPTKSLEDIPYEVTVADAVVVSPSTFETLVTSNDFDGIDNNAALAEVGRIANLPSSVGVVATYVPAPTSGSTDLSGFTRFVVR